MLPLRHHAHLHSSTTAKPVSSSSTAKIKVEPIKALTINPQCPLRLHQTLKTVEKWIASIGVERAAFGRIFEMLAQLLTCNHYLDLYPILDFLLNEVEIPFSDVRTSILRCHNMLICNDENRLRPSFRLMRKLGFVVEHRITCQNAVLLVYNIEKYRLPELEYFKGLGLTYSEVVRSPASLTFSIENNCKPKAECFPQN